MAHRQATNASVSSFHINDVEVPAKVDEFCCVPCEFVKKVLDCSLCIEEFAWAAGPEIRALSDARVRAEHIAPLPLWMTCRAKRILIRENKQQQRRSLFGNNNTNSSSSSSSSSTNSSRSSSSSMNASRSQIAKSWRMFVALWLQVDVRMWCSSFVHRVLRCCSQCSPAVTFYGCLTSEKRDSHTILLLMWQCPHNMMC